MWFPVKYLVLAFVAGLSYLATYLAIHFFGPVTAMYLISGLVIGFLLQNKSTQWLAIILMIVGLAFILQAY